MIRIFSLALAGLALILGTDPVAADDAAIKRYRNYLPAQILALPESVRQKEIPIAYLQAANGADSELGRLVFAGMLNTLMYKGMSEYDASVRAFQKDLGDQPSGKLTVGQIFQLGKRAEMHSILMADYNELCIEVMTDAEKRGRYWAERGAKELEDKLMRPPQ